MFESRPSARSVAQQLRSATTTTAARSTRSRRDAMSYLVQYARRPDSIAARTPAARVDERTRLNRPGLVRRRVRARLRRGHDGAPASPRPAIRSSCCRSPTARTRSTSSSRSRRPSCARTRSSRPRRCSARSTASATASPRRPSSPRGVTADPPSNSTKGGARCRT